MADNTVRVTGNLQENQSTAWLLLRGGHNFFDVSVSGTFTATVHLQRKRPGEADAAARDVESYDVPVEKIGEMHGHWDVRLTVKTGNHTSGTAVAELGT